VSRPIVGRIRSFLGERAQIDVGSADGVKEGMKFLVFRGGKLLGRFIAEHVERHETQGHLQGIKERVKEGDTVYANPRYF
jgi:hypothetical protein